ncbi:MAG: AbrB/MazE/SpoVT family DNA-binding domain-containing protein [Terracidiphilus sp.]
MPTAMVTFNGRITLPSNVRKELGLKTGDNVDFVEIEKGRVAIVPGSLSLMDLEDLDDDSIDASSEESWAEMEHSI